MGTRLLLLLFAFPELVQVEELYNGTLAREIVRGPILPLLRLRYIEYQSGSLIVSLTAIPFFYLFGESYFTLKLVALLFSSATLAVFYALLKRFYSAKAAMWGGLIFVFPPRLFALLNLKVEGANSQAILITVAIWYLFFSLLRHAEDRRPGVDREWRKNASAFLIGLLSSFGVWFCPVVLIVILCIGGIAFARDRLFCFKGRFLWAFAGFWAGAVPAIVDYRSTGYVGLKYLLTQPYRGRTSSFIASVAELWGKGLLDSFSSKNFFLPSGAVNGYFYALVLICIVVYLYRCRGDIALFLRAMASSARRQRLSFESVKGVAFILYVALFTLAYGLSKYHIAESGSAIDAYRYMVSLYPFLFIMVALAVEKTRGQSGMLAGMVAVGIALGAVEIVGSIEPEGYGKGFQLKGYDYEMLGLRLCEQMGDAPNEAMGLIFEKMADRADRDACARGYAFVFTRERLKEGDGAGRFTDRIGSMDGRWRPYFYRALGQLVTFDAPPPDGVRAWTAIPNAIDGKYVAYYYEGLGSAVRSRYQGDDEKQRECGRHVPPPFKPAFETGLNVPYPVL
jgi:hypothetical protein